MQPLLEREDDLAALERVVRDGAAGVGRLVLVGGEAGIGKTSLIRALRGRVTDEVGFVVGSCEPLSVPVPLAPLRELADGTGGRLAGGDPLTLAGELVDVLTRRAPVVAVVEDAHWADPSTLDVLRLVAHRLEDQHLAVIVTYRDDEVAANPELERLLGDLATSPIAQRLRLQPLSEAGVRELADPAGLDATRLSRITGGNPFLVVETIAAGEHRWGGAASIRDATLARASRLGPDARAVVDAATVIGMRVDPGLLEQVAPGSGDAVAEALARGVLVADGAALGFRHELIREAIEASIPPPRRTELHGRVVAALATGTGELDHARLAHHAELAGMPHDACRYAILAAQDAARVGAVGVMGLQTRRALRLGDELEPAERFELLLQSSRAANFASTRLEDAVEPADEAIALAVRIGDRVMEGRALIVLAWALWSLDRVIEARDAAERAVMLLERTSDVPALARAHATHIRIQATAFDPQVAIDDGPRAFGLASGPGLEETRLDVEISVALARGHRGDPGALDPLSDACRAAREAGLTIQTVRAYVNLVLVAVILRRHALVDATAREALVLFENYQTTIPGNAIESFRARSLLDRGRWAEALQVVARRDRDYAAEKVGVLGTEGVIAIRRGDRDGARSIEEAWKCLSGVPESSRHGTLRVQSIESAWLRGERTDALRHIAAGLASPVAGQFARTAGEVALWSSRYGVVAEPPARIPEPVALELAGDWRAAIDAWRELEAPYEAALAALPGDDRAARTALATLQGLGATATIRAFTRARGELRGRLLRGPRRSTLANAAGLTKRQQEVLEQLATGATNAAIAGALHLSERTVDHHVAAILSKLGAANRVSAVEQARARGLLSPGHPS